MFHRGFGVPAFCHLVDEQLQRRESDFERRMLGEYGNDVLAKEALQILSHLLPPRTRLYAENAFQRSANVSIDSPWGMSLPVYSSMYPATRHEARNSAIEL